MTLQDDLENQADPAARKALLRQLLEARLNQSTPVEQAPLDQPASVGQRALALFDQMYPDSPAYNLCLAAEVHGELDLAALQVALDALIARHPILRTGLIEHDQQVVQRVRPASSAAVREIIGGADLDAVVLAETKRRFDLANENLLRALVIRRASEPDVLLLSSHHIALDLWSFGRLLHDLQLAYPAALTGSPIEFGPAPLGYDEFVGWQQQYLAGPRGRRAADYWRQNLSSESNESELQLPLDRPRPDRRRHRAGVVTRELEPATSTGITELARRVGTTPFAVTAAVVCLLLQRYATSTEVRIGSVANGRGKAAYEAVLGYFANLIVLRAELPAGQSFGQLVEQLRDTVLDALEHSDYPYPMVAAECGAGQPLFDVAFYYESTTADTEDGLSLFATGHPSARLRLGPLTLTPYRVPVQGDEHDLTLFVDEVDGRLLCSLRYALDIFDRPTAEMLLDQLARLAAAGLAEPDRPHAEFDLLGPAATRQLLAFGDRSADAVAGPSSVVHDLVFEQAARTPAAAAVDSPAGSLTYRELVTDAHEFAQLLARRGIGRGDRVGLSADAHPRWPAAMLGILLTGAAYVPLDPTYPIRRLEYMIADAELSLLVSDAVLPARLAELEGLEIALLSLDERDRGPVVELAGPRADDLAYIIYTSGSTGRPKGVLVEHGGLVDLDLAHREFLPATPGRRILQNASISFDVSTWEWLMALTTGATLVLALREQLRPGPPLLETLQNKHITALSATPSVLATMTATELPELTEITSVGEAISADLVRAWAPGRIVLNAYGPTESTVFCTGAILVPDQGTPAIGRPMAGHRLYVLDDELRPVPCGAIGELYVGGSGVTRGYHAKPDLTARKYSDDPYSTGRLYRTGDRVRWDRDGVLHYIGRTDFQVKIRGVRTEPLEVQQVLAEHPAVHEAMVLARPDQTGALQLIGYLVAVPGRAGELTPTELRAFAADRLASSMIPSAFLVLPEFPLNPNGKVDRAALPEPDRELTDKTVVPPETDTERLVAECWSQVLGHSRIGRTDNFFALGGHSLLATKVLALLRPRLERELALGQLFEFPVLADLAAHLDQAQASAPSGDEPSRIPPRTIDGDLELSAAQRRIWFGEQLHPDDDQLQIGGELYLDGPIRARALVEAFDRAVARHEALRTTFHTIGREPRQRVELVGSSRLFEIDLTDTVESLPAVLAAFRSGRFELAEGPVRAQLIILSDQRHVLQLAVHHIASDGWSVRLLVNEILRDYQAIVSGHPLDPSRPEVQYPDFAVWQNRSADLHAGLAHWVETLADSPAALEVPTDRPRRELGFRPAGRTRVQLTAAETAGVRDEAAEHGASLAMSVLTGYQQVLSRWSGQADVLVGMPVAGRNREEVRSTVGLFVNTVVVRTDLSGSEDRAERLGRVRSALLAAEANQDVPFERIVHELAPVRDLRRTPVFQVLFNMLNLDEVDLDLPGIGIRLVEAEDAEARYDLALYARPQSDGGLELDLVYDTDLFDAATVSAFLAQVRDELTGTTTANSIARTPELDPQPELDLEALLDRATRQDPGATALRPIGRGVSYAELFGAVSATARQLSEAGIDAGDVVAIEAERGCALAVAVLAAIRCGAVFSILDQVYPADRLAASRSQLAPAATLRADRVGLAPALTRHEHGRTRPGLGYIGFTSGSTGQPKGVLGRLAPLAHFIGWYREEFRIGRDDVFALTSGLSHDPLLRDLLVPLATGAELVVPDANQLATPDGYGRFLAEHGVTVWHLTPPTLRFLAGLADNSLPRLRLAVFGGDVLTGREIALLRRIAPQAEIVSGYGTTETPQLHGWYRVPAGDLAPEEIVPLGQGIPGVALAVETGGRPARIGELGEIVLHSDQLARGYLDDSAGGFDGPGRYRTGDRGRLGADGLVRFAGRGDRQVKVRGHRVDLAGIEAAAAEHPDITEVIVRAAVDAAGETGLWLWAGATELDQTELRRWLQTRLPAAAVPDRIVASRTPFPLSPNGKVDVARLPRTSDPAPASSLRTDTERSVASVWCRLLDLPAVDRDASFFDVGGHSLLLVQLQAELQDHLGVELTVLDLFRHPTLAGLAAAIEARRTGSIGGAGAEADRASSDRANRAAERRARLRKGQGR